MPIQKKATTSKSATQPYTRRIRRRTQRTACEATGFRAQADARKCQARRCSGMANTTTDTDLVADVPSINKNFETGSTQDGRACPKMAYTEDATSTSLRLVTHAESYDDEQVPYIESRNSRSKFQSQLRLALNEQKNTITDRSTVEYGTKPSKLFATQTHHKHLYNIGLRPSANMLEVQDIQSSHDGTLHNNGFPCLTYAAMTTCPYNVDRVRTTEHMDSTPIQDTICAHPTYSTASFNFLSFFC